MNEKLSVLIEFIGLRLS